MPPSLVLVGRPLAARGLIRQEVHALNGILVEREPWVPVGASPAEAAHRQAKYGS